MTILRDLLKERPTLLPETRREDFLEQLRNDMENKGFLSEDFVVKLIFGGILFATFESISAVIAPAFELLSEHPR